MTAIDRRASVITLAFTIFALLAASAHADQTRDRFRTRGSVQSEDTAQASGLSVQAASAASSPAPVEAPAAFDNLTNGFLPQGPPFDSIDEDNVEPLASFNDNRFIFEEAETIEDGLGPTYNAQGCRECHQNVVTGGASQIAEHRTGRLSGGQFFESLGGSLVHSRAIHPDIVERVAFQDTIRTLRISTNTLGAGFVEAIANTTLLAQRSRQPFSMRGTALEVPVLEANGQLRIGRFGWKSQHASLQSFSADAYLNEMGITTPTLPDENTSSGVYVGIGSGYDLVPDPEDDGIDVIAFADFMRATKAPPRGPQNNTTRAGEQIFNQLGCAVCHTPAIVTASAGTVINGGAFTVPAALASKTIHPYSDFLLHDIGSGDGIPVLPGAAFVGTAKQIRTAPLWGLRTRNRLMHDGLSFTREDAILRHGGQAGSVRARFQRLSAAEQAQLIAFLDSL